MALKREVTEEANVSVESPILIGYRKIIASVGQKNEEGNGKYPFPISYIPFYLAQVFKMHDFKGGTEIKQRKFFKQTEAVEVLKRDSNYKIVEYAYSKL